MRRPTSSASSTRCPTRSGSARSPRTREARGSSGSPVSRNCPHPATGHSGPPGSHPDLANVDPGLSVAMLTALRANDYPAAREIWQRIRPFEALRAAGESENNVSVVKEALAQLGLCRRDVRPPCQMLDDAGRAEVRRMLTEWGMLAADEKAGGPAQFPLVRRGRPAQLQPPHPYPPARPRSRGAPRQAGDRHPEHVERHQPVPHAPAGTGRTGQARSVGSGRVPVGVPGRHLV